ncbi:MAG: HRDC domain-containing protein, partial [Desulfovibrionaceae bacterium]
DLDLQGFGGLSLNAASWEILKGRREVRLRLEPPRERARGRKGERGRKRAADRTLARALKRAEGDFELHGTEAETLWEALRAKRLGLAQHLNVPPYAVFSDKTLLEMVRLRPRNEAELLNCSGVGRIKLERFGAAFLEVLAAHEAEHGRPAGLEEAPPPEADGPGYDPGDAPEYDPDDPGPGVLSSPPPSPGRAAPRPLNGVRPAIAFGQRSGRGHAASDGADQAGEPAAASPGRSLSRGRRGAEEPELSATVAETLRLARELSARAAAQGTPPPPDLAETIGADRNLKSATIWQHLDKLVALGELTPEAVLPYTEAQFACIRDVLGQFCADGAPVFLMEMHRVLGGDVPFEHLRLLRSATEREAQGA